MKRSNKATFFIVAILIFAFTALSFFGVSNYYGDNKITYIKGAEDIRWGIDIQGGVEAIFTPDVGEAVFETITDAEMESAETVIKTRLVNKHITDSEVYTDLENKQIIVRFPWQSEEEDYDPAAAIKELGETAMVIFREGSESTGNIVLQGSQHVDSAAVGYDNETNQPVVQLKLTPDGASAFATATAANVGETISIWMDEQLLSAPTVNDAITNGEAIITGMGSVENAQALADQINAGSLPFALKIDDTIRVINPTLGEQALNVMFLAAVIAFAVICLIMIVLYRLPGVIASIALLGQVAGMIACTSGFISAFDSFTLTLPGIAGIILSIGMGVDANVITAERIKEELRNGRTLDGAIDSGYDNGFSAILDGNVTVIIISAILMGVFGPTGGMWAKLLTPFMWLYNHSIGLIPGLEIFNSITGEIYSFGYTLLIGVVFNFIMGVTASRLMLKGVSRFQALRKPGLYGGVKNVD